MAVFSGMLVNTLYVFHTYFDYERYPSGKSYLWNFHLSSTGAIREKIDSSRNLDVPSHPKLGIFLICNKWLYYRKIEMSTSQVGSSNKYDT